MLVSNPVHAVFPEQSLLFKVIFERCILFWKCPMQSFSVCLTWPVTVLNYPSLYTVFPRVLTGREIAGVKGQNQSLLLHFKHIASSPALKGIWRVYHSLIYVWKLLVFRLGKPDPSKFSVDTMFPGALETLLALFQQFPCFLKQCVPVDIFRFPARNWAEPKREGVLFVAAVFPNKWHECDLPPALGYSFLTPFVNLSVNYCLSKTLPSACESNYQATTVFFGEI